MPGVGLVFDDPVTAPDRLDAAAPRPLARHRDRPCSASAALGGPLRLRRRRGPAADTRRRELPRGCAPLRLREGAARRRSPNACASSTPTCSRAGTSSTSTSPSSRGSLAHRGVPLELGRGVRVAAHPPGGSPTWRRHRRASRGGSCSTASSFCAAPSCDSTTTASTPWPATSWARARRSRARARADEILRLYEDDRPRFVEYNSTDARLALEILERLRLVELTVERSRLTGLPPDRVAALDRRLRLPLSRASSGRRAHRRAERARDVDVARGAGRRPRPRADPGALPQRRRPRLQEPLSEPHPHLRDRPAQPRPPRDRRTARRSPIPSSPRTGPPSRAQKSHPARRCSTRCCPGARPRAARATRSRATRSRSS